MLDLVINHHTYLGLIIFAGALAKTFGKRFSMTRDEWHNLSHLNQYGQLIFGFPTGAVALSLPHITLIATKHFSIGATLIVTLIAISFLLAVFSVIMGVVLCIGGSPALMAEGKSWR